MRRNLSFFAGILVGALLFGGTAAYAAGILATPIEDTEQIIILNGQEVELTGYNINGNNYFKLRDIAQAVDFGVRWDESIHAVIIDTLDGYTPESEIAATPTAKLEPKPMTDHRAEANPAIFTGSYTRDAYNGIRQTILGGDALSFAGDEATRQTMNEVTAALGCYPGYYLMTDADGNSTCGVRYPTAYDAAAEHTSGFIAGLAGMSDSDQVTEIAWYVCDRLTYSASATATPGKVLSGDGVQAGSCMSYARSFMFLCQRAGIPCIFVCSDSHQWNMVYIDGVWWDADMTGADIGDDASLRPRITILHENLAGRIYKDRQPDVTTFAMELLVPGSTK